MKRDGWVKDVDGIWILRFRYDWDSWEGNPKVLIDKGRLMPNGIPLLMNIPIFPALLKCEFINHFSVL